MTKFEMNHNFIFTFKLSAASTSVLQLKVEASRQENQTESDITSVKRSGKEFVMDAYLSDFNLQHSEIISFNFNKSLTQGCISSNFNNL